MAEKINWNFVVQALNGPYIDGAGSLEPETYQVIDFTLNNNSTHDASHPATISGIGAISMLIISTSTPSPNITYTGKNSLPGEPTGGHVLDAPHIFLGSVANAFLGGAATPPMESTTLTFTNATNAPVEIRILIGRKTA